MCVTANERAEVASWWASRATCVCGHCSTGGSYVEAIVLVFAAVVAGSLGAAACTGAGSGGQNDIGTGVIGGMLAATVLAIFLAPLFFVLVRGGLRSKKADNLTAPAPEVIL